MKQKPEAGSRWATGKEMNFSDLEIDFSRTKVTFESLLGMQEDAPYFVSQELLCLR